MFRTVRIVGGGASPSNKGSRSWNKASVKICRSGSGEQQDITKCEKNGAESWLDDNKNVDVGNGSWDAINNNGHNGDLYNCENALQAMSLISSSEECLGFV